MSRIEVVLIAAILAVLFAIVYFNQSACKKTADMMGMRHDFIFGQGCMIEPKDGQWIPLKNYRVQP